MLNFQWDTVLDILKARLDKQDFDRWFAHATPRNNGSNSLIIEVADDFSMRWIKNNYIELLRDILWDLYGQHFGVEVSVQTDGGKMTGLTDASEANLMSRYTFDRFVEGPSNALALAAAKAVAVRSDMAFNPLFIYGGVGMGKTHLLQAIAHEVIKNGRYRVTYVSAETLVNEIMTALQRKALDEVRRKYRGNTDILLVDDIQYLVSGKTEFVQREFFHTFNELHGAGKHIVISSDMRPNELPQLAERLRSRLKWGLVVELNPPDRETRLKIAQAKLARERIELLPEVIAFVVDNFTSSVRELEGAINQLTAHAMLRQREIDLDLAEKLLKPAEQISHRTVTLTEVASKVAMEFNVSVDDMQGKSRRANIALARQITYQIAEELCGATHGQIGRFLGNRTHSTVISGLRSLKNKMKKDPALQRTIRLIKERLMRGDGIF